MKRKKGLLTIHEKDKPNILKVTKMNDWKEFLVKSLISPFDAWDGVPEQDPNDLANTQCLLFEQDLMSFFVGEVERIENRIKECGLLGKIRECNYLKGRLDLVKELAGVEKRNE